jgi:hypothetical protein
MSNLIGGSITRSDQILVPDMPEARAVAVAGRCSVPRGDMVCMGGAEGLDWIYTLKPRGGVIDRRDILFNGTLSECLDVYRDIHHEDIICT